MTRRTSVIAAAVGVLLLGVAVLWTWRRNHRVAELTACERQAARINDSLGYDARLELNFRWNRLPNPGTPAPEFVDYIDEWVAVQTRVCVEANVDRSRDPISAEPIRRCLEQRRVAFDDLVSGLVADVDASKADGLEALARLPSPASCLEVDP